MQHRGKGCGGLDAGGADEDGASGVCQAGCLVGGGFPFRFESAEDARWVLLANAGAIGGNAGDFEGVGFAEFRGDGGGGSSHAGQMGILAKIGLDRDTRGLPGEGGDGNLFLGFNSLVKSVLPFAAIQSAAGRFVDDDDFFVGDDIIAVPEKAEACDESFFDSVVDAIHIDRFNQARFGGEEYPATTLVSQAGFLAINAIIEINIAL